MLQQQVPAVLYKDSHVAVIDLTKKRQRKLQYDDDGAPTAGYKCQMQPNFLLKQLTAMVTESILCDFSIDNGQMKYKIHRVVLTAQSPKYARLILEPVDNSPPSEITLTGASQQVLEEILEYMYTGEFILSDDNVEQATNASFQLDLTKLKERCVTYLHGFNLNNVLKYIDIVTKHQQDELCHKMRGYAQKYFAVLSSVPDFLQCSFDTLSSLLEKSKSVEDADGYDMEIGKLEGIIRWLSENVEQRQEYGPKLLETVDLSKLTLRDVRDRIESRTDIFPTEQCVDSLLKAYKFHAVSLARECGKSTIKN